MAKKFDVKKIGLKVAGLGAGAVAANLVNKAVPNLNPKIRAAGKILVGAALPSFVKNEFVADAGAGMVAMGVADLVGQLVPSLAVSGTNGMDESLAATGDYVTDTGYKSEYPVSGDFDNALNGTDDIEGYDHEGDGTE